MIARGTLKFNSLRRAKFEDMPDLFQLVCGAISVHEIKILLARKIAGNFKIWLTSESIK